MAKCDPMQYVTLGRFQPYAECDSFQRPNSEYDQMQSVTKIKPKYDCYPVHSVTLCCLFCLWQHYSPQLRSLLTIVFNYFISKCLRKNKFFFDKFKDPPFYNLRTLQIKFCCTFNFRAKFDNGKQMGAKWIDSFKF